MADDDRVRARIELHDGSSIEGTVPWSDKGWTLLPFGGRWFRFSVLDEGVYVFLECQNICHDFRATEIRSRGVPWCIVVEPQTDSAPPRHSEGEP